MNAYTETLMKLASGQNYFHRSLIERLMEEHKVMRKQNAALRTHQEGVFEPVLSVIFGKQYEVQERTQIAPEPLDVSDDLLLVFKPVPIVILKEV